MKALILGTGPSLNECPHINLDTGEVTSEGFVVVGMNDVPTRVACDWWVFADWASWWKWSRPDPEKLRSEIAHNGVIGEPQVFTRRQQLEYYRGKRQKLANRPHTDIESRDEAISRLADQDFTLCAETANVPAKVEECGRGTRFTVRQFTGPLSIMLAYHLGAEYVEAWGCEMAGKNSFNGRGGSRDDSRWRYQLMVWGSYVEAFAVRGVKVYRADSDGVLNIDTGNPKIEKVLESRPGRWTYHNAHGRVTQTFTAANEADFRRKLEAMLGRDKAQSVKVEEV